MEIWIPYIDETAKFTEEQYNYLRDRINQDKNKNTQTQDKTKMSPIVTFSEQDILRNKIVTPGWYRVRVDRVGQKPSKGDNPDTTTIWPIEGTILKNAENGSEEFAGVPSPAGWNFNDNPKAKGFMIGFFNSVGATVKPGERMELAAAEGHELEVFIENDTYEGRVVNRINHKYRAVKS